MSQNVKLPDARPDVRPDVPKVYLLPNLMTAGNLFCGFMAILQIIQGNLEQFQGNEHWLARYEMSLMFILGAFIFDLLDGRLARLGGKESVFGKEFDSLADLVSFGLAPALLVAKIILVDLPENFRWVGWLVAFIYLLGGAMRLARFNIVASQPQPNGSKDFLGFPIPAAAGLVASITLLLLQFYAAEPYAAEREIGAWKHLLPGLLLFLSFMMYSKIKYPSFKTIDWRAKRSVPQLLCTVIVVIVVAKTWRYSLAVVFLAYLIYGFVRPFVSKKIREEIEEEEEEGETPAR
ncbi:MAG: CDP-diacylglycerol--serine O-phosphatidyltransferase [Verrucomicrobiae bacterium]|nr:CDP-diacylglycerol--serine O-phosphatidyltransferase [Verrucomicrobiae bacterium]